MIIFIKLILLVISLSFWYLYLRSIILTNIFISYFVYNFLYIYGNNIKLCKKKRKETLRYLLRYIKINKDSPFDEDRLYSKMFFKSGRHLLIDGVYSILFSLLLIYISELFFPFNKVIGIKVDYFTLYMPSVVISIITLSTSIIKSIKYYKSNSSPIEFSPIYYKLNNTYILAIIYTLISYLIHKI